MVGGVEVLPIDRERPRRRSDRGRGRTEGTRTILAIEHRLTAGEVDLANAVAAVAVDVGARYRSDEVPVRRVAQLRERDRLEQDAVAEGVDAHRGIEGGIEVAAR